MRINTVVGLEDDEVVINCAELTDEVRRIQRILSEELEQSIIEGFSGETLFHIRPDEVLFFETEGGAVFAHTVTGCYHIKLRLYELENTLPRNFIRISKSAILNTRLICSVTGGISSSRLVRFSNCHKQVYISRKYYGGFKKMMKGMVENEN